MCNNTDNKKQDIKKRRNSEKGFENEKKKQSMSEIPLGRNSQSEDEGDSGLPN